MGFSFNAISRTILQVANGCQGYHISKPKDKLSSSVYTGPVGNSPCYREPGKVKVSDILKTEPKWDLDEVSALCAQE